jgi:hypothetical protein
MNIRNFYDLYVQFTKAGDRKSALYYFEKAALLAENKIAKIKLMAELIGLLYANKDEKKLKLTIRDFNKIDIVLEAVFLESCRYPY